MVYTLLCKSSPMINRELQTLYNEIMDKAVVKGKFKLSSGSESDYYVDIKRLYGEPNTMIRIADQLFGNFSELNIDFVAGSGVGGTPLASSISVRHGIRLSIVRSKAKGYGTEKEVEGYVPKAGDRGIVVDDVSSENKSIRKVGHVLRDYGANVIEYQVVVNRDEYKKVKLNAPLKYLFTSGEVLRGDRTFNE